MGNQGHSSESIRVFVEMIRAGAIGRVTEVHCACDAVVDPVFWALNLGLPTAIQAEVQDYDPREHAEVYPPGSRIVFEFPAKEGRGPVTLVWHDGRIRIPRPPELEPDRKVVGTGAVVIGTEGKIMYGSHGAGGCRIIPESKMREFQPPRKKPAPHPGGPLCQLAQRRTRGTACLFAVRLRRAAERDRPARHDRHPLRRPASRIRPGGDPIHQLRRGQCLSQPTLARGLGPAARLTRIAHRTMKRRSFLQGTGAGLAGVAVPAARSAATPAASERFLFALNAATIRGHKLPLADQLRLAAAAGYDAYEPWISDMEPVASSLTELARECADRGLAVVSVIGFAKWIVNDPAERARGVEQMKRDMDLAARLGARMIAAPPSGASKDADRIPFDAIAERYAAVVEAGRSVGVVPQLEIWGASANLSRLDEAAYVLARCGCPEAALLADVYHIVRGGSPPAALRIFGRSALRCFHINDVPAGVARESLRDADRVWPGDGVAPIGDLLAAFAANRAQPVLSLELFNAEYWKLPAAEIARIGLEKTRAVTAASPTTAG